MTILLWILALVLVVAGIVGLVLPALPGPLLLFAGLWLAAWAEGYVYVGTATLVFLGILAVVASLADFVAGAFGARRYGASGRSVTGAALGAVIPIDLPEGSVKVRIPEGAQSGRQLRVRGKGIPGNPPGDLLLDIQVMLPSADDPKARAIYEQMAREIAFDPRRDERT
jgi:hypothetical protein